MRPRSWARARYIRYTRHTALHYVRYSLYPQGMGSHSWPTVPSHYWSVALVPLTLVVVPCTDVLWMFHVPNWFFCNRPRRVSSCDGLEMGDHVAAGLLANRVRGLSANRNSGQSTRDSSSGLPAEDDAAKVCLRVSRGALRRPLPSTSPLAPSDFPHIASRDPVRSTTLVIR